MTSITYPVSQITYDNVTLGAFADVQFDATLVLGTAEGLDDLGRVRVFGAADATNIYIARSAKGYEDGTLVIQNDAYITVWDDYRVWAKIPYFNTDTGVDYKDGTIEVGEYTDAEIPPVSNCGPGTAGTIDSGTDLLTVQFPRDGVDVSFTIAEGATIATYDWDVKDGTITVGTSASAVITATFPAGFRWVAMTITDSNGISHTSRCPVLAIDPEDDPTFKAFSIKQNFEKKGQTLELEIFDELNREDYPDGTLVMFWWDEPEDPGDRNHMRFIGWLDKENHNIRRGRTGLEKSTRLSALDVAGRLSLLPGFPQALTREEEDTDGEEFQWSYMPGLDMHKALHYLLMWHSTALSVADFTFPSYLQDYDAMRLDSGANDLFSQVDQQAQKIVPDHYLTCNAQGQMNVRRDWRLDDLADRPAVADTVDVQEFNDLSFEYNRHPKVHVLRSAAIVASTDWVVIDDEDTLPLAFSIAPSDASAFSQGSQEMTQNEGLTISQEELNICEGHRFALVNSRFGNFTWKDPSGTGFYLWEPALMNRVQLNLNSLLTTYRGLPFTSAIGMTQTMTVDYTRNRFGTSIKPSVTWTKEEEGFPALTYDPEEDATTPVPEVIGFVPPDLDDEVYSGDITGYILWDNEDIVRTWDLQAGSPTWELITGDVTGNIYDGQYVITAADTCGMWLMTSTAIWWCEDIMASPPVWNDVLPIATVIASDPAPLTGTIIFQCMYNWAAQPGFLCVATAPDNNDATYAHALFWMTDDYGATWTQTDMDGFLTDDDEDFIRGYCFAGVFGMNIHRSSGTIWCLRTTPRIGSSTGYTAVFRSTDLGVTWSMAYDYDNWSAGQCRGSILDPYPDTSDPSYIQRGINDDENLPYISENNWTTSTAVAIPTGYYQMHNHSNVVQRLNKRTFDNTHVMGIWRETGDGSIDLMESYDKGATWTALTTGLGNGFTVPNGWPPDPDQWVLIQSRDTLGANTIRLTLNNFSSMASKTGNLASILPGGTWKNGIGNGFALPKLGVNAD
jgi:hypothetical protein